MRTPTLTILALLLAIIIIPFTTAVDSTNPADYFFYDDYENASTEELYYYDEAGKFTYSSAQAYAGTKSLEIGYAMDVNPEQHIGTNATGFTTEESSSAYCMDFQFYQNAHATAGNEEQGIWKGQEWFSGSVFLDSDSGGDDNIQVSNTTDAYYNIGASGALNTWKYYKLCYYNGYDLTGETYVGIWNSTDLIYNLSGVAQVDLNRTNFINRLPGPGAEHYYDNMRIWNFTAYGDTPPQEAGPPPTVQNITVFKVITNDNGGTATAGSFTFFINATTVANASTTNLSTGTYRVHETGVAGYALTYTGDCDSNGIIVLAASESKSCTMTNNDIPGAITVIKNVINDNNGTLGIANFSLFIDANPATSGTPYAYNAGAHTVSETAVPGYTGVIGGNCTSGGSVTVGLNESKTCTITNNDNAPVLPDPQDEAFTNALSSVIYLFVILALFGTAFVYADQKGYVPTEMKKYFYYIIAIIAAIIIISLLFV